VKNTAEVTGGKPIAILLQTISGVSAVNPLVGFYDVYEGKREMLFFYFVHHLTHRLQMQPGPAAAFAVVSPKILLQDQIGNLFYCILITYTIK
jgi:hypothetical protein